MAPPKSFLDQSPTGIVQNNRMMLIVGFVVLGGLLFYFMLKAQGNHKEAVKDNQPKAHIDSESAKEEDPEWLRKYSNTKIDIFKPLTKPQTPQEIERQAVSTEQRELKIKETQDRYAADLEIQKLEDDNKIEEKKLELSALKSPLAIPVPAPPAAASAENPATTNADVSADLRQMQDSINNSKSGTTSTPGGQNQNDQDEKLQFLKKGDQEDDYLKNKLVKPISPYEVKAGTYIPASLISGINSDLPGSIVAMVRENVYDSVTGNMILIPQGAKLVGSYDSKVTFGQAGVLVVWTRLIMPNGSSIDLDKMQGADMSGYAGFRDKLNNHYFKIYSNALLLSLVGAGYDLLNNPNSSANGQYSAEQSVAANVGQELSNVSSKTLEKNMDVQPTITIRPGYEFNIIVIKDIVLEETKDVEGTLESSI
jgi:type IV secretory pathway VirB10-like protein